MQFNYYLAVFEGGIMLAMAICRELLNVPTGAAQGFEVVERGICVCIIVYAIYINTSLAHHGIKAHSALPPEVSYVRAERKTEALLGECSKPYDWST